LNIPYDPKEPPERATVSLIAELHAGEGSGTRDYLDEHPICIAQPPLLQELTKPSQRIEVDFLASSRQVTGAIKKISV
jgi:hypothetical protein